MSAVITVENLSKRYVLSHRQEGGLALRDVIAGQARRITSRLLHPLRRPDVSGSAQEPFWALRDISFKINQGDRVGIIGRNGAGKSTLLKVLSRITEPTSGRVRIRGRVVSLLEVGTGFHPELSGRENIFLNGAILGMSRQEIKSKFDEIVDFAEMERFIDTPVKRYSSGMYVRLAFAVAAHLEPDILVVDEVLAVGDAQFQKKCLGKMEDVGREGRTVLFVSHNMTTIRSLCERCILLEQGRISFQGDVARTIDLYNSGFDARGPLLSAADMVRDSKCSLRAKIVDVAVVASSAVNPSFLDGKEIFTVRLTVAALTEVKCSAQIVICDDMQPLSYLDSGTLHNKIYTLPKGTSTIECSVGPLQLYAGNYRINCSLNIPFKEVIDELQSAYRFEIRECDPYGTGYNIERKHGFGLFHIPHSWSE
jgi:ABC-type polysaccharide/polyol phosphate transport system, ATPase component